jgi:hypothetical protein
MQITDNRSARSSNVGMPMSKPRRQVLQKHGYIASRVGAHAFSQDSSLVLRESKLDKIERIAVTVLST